MFGTTSVTSRGRTAFHADITNDRDIMTTYNRHDNSRQHIERDCRPESSLFDRQTVQGFLRNNLTFDHARVNVTRFPLGTTRQKRAARRASRLTLHELIPDAAPHRRHLARRAGRGPTPIIPPPQRKLTANCSL